MLDKLASHSKILILRVLLFLLLSISLLILIVLVVSHDLIMRVFLCFDVLVVFELKGLPIAHVALRYHPLSKYFNESGVCEHGNASRRSPFPCIVERCIRRTIETALTCKETLLPDLFNVYLFLPFKFHLILI